MPATDEWLSVTEVARRIGASTSTVRSLIRANRLRAVQRTEGGKYVIRESEIVRYLAEIETGTAAPQPAVVAAA
ncbi:MAG TPA: helix-turn-helix domain-containing protein [Trebonia sp.]|nr:helix-turn-helix domain-containing protein [Trebonia sp.]